MDEGFEESEPKTKYEKPLSEYEKSHIYLKKKAFEIQEFIINTYCPTVLTKQLDTLSSVNINEVSENIRKEFADYVATFRKIYKNSIENIKNLNDQDKLFKDFQQYNNELKTTIVYFLKQYQLRNKNKSTLIGGLIENLNLEPSYSQVLPSDQENDLEQKMAEM